MSERIDVFYKEFTRIPVVMQAQGEIGRTLPVSVSLTRGNLSVIKAVVERPVIRTDRVPVHLEYWIQESAGIPGTSSSKFPIVVRVWNYVVGHFKVVAHVAAYTFRADVTGSFPGAIDGEDAYPKIKIIYKVWNAVRYFTKLLPNIEHKSTKKIGIYVTTWKDRFKALVMAICPRTIKQGAFMATSVELQQKQTLPLHTRVQHQMHRVIRLFTQPTSRVITYRAAFRAVVQDIPLVYRAKFKTALLRLESATSAKCAMFLHPIKHYQASKLIAYLRKTIDVTASKCVAYIVNPVQKFWPTLAANLLSELQTRFQSCNAYLHRSILAPIKSAVQVKTSMAIQRTVGFMYTYLIAPVQSYTRAIFIYPHRVEIEKVLAYIKVLFIWFKRRPHVIMQHYKVMRKQFIFSNLNFIRRVHRILTNAQPIKRLQKIYFNSLVALRPVRIYLNAWQQWLKSRVIWNTKKVTHPVKLLFLPTANVRKILLQFDVLTTLAEENVIFVTGHRTVYLQVIALLLNKTRQFAKVQWWVRQIKMANEGYSTEIIFDLDDKGQGIGPLPPLGVESWQGGYVEYPFKGMGTQATEEATGYLSPEGLSWVRNASMIWGKSTSIFDGTEGEE